MVFYVFSRRVLVHHDFRYFCFVSDDDKSLREMLEAGYRIQNPKHHVSNDVQGGGVYTAEQVQDETPRSKTLLSEHGGDGEESWRSHSSTSR